EATWSQSLPEWIGVASPGAGVPGRGAAAVGARQPALGGAAGELVRARHQPGLSRPGGALRRCDPADAGAPAARQGEGRGWGTGGGARDSARLRNQRFFSLAELNAAIAALTEELNARPMRKLGVCPPAVVRGAGSAGAAGDGGEKS